MITRFIRGRAAPVMALAIVALASLASGMALGDRGASASRTTTISVRDNFFSPKSKTVSRNTRVVWRWRGSNLHNIRFRRVPRGASKRGTGFKTSGRFSKRLTKRGTYRYVCTLHESVGMKGSIRVR